MEGSGVESGLLNGVNKTVSSLVSFGSCNLLKITNAD